MTVPSRQEAFGQTASEALASGTPVVAFDATGPSDIVDHKKTGYLAQPFDSSDLARGIEWILADENRRNEMGKRARSCSRTIFGGDCCQTVSEPLRPNHVIVHWRQGLPAISRQRNRFSNDSAEVVWRELVLIENSRVFADGCA